MLAAALLSLVPAPRIVPPYDKRIVYVGRFDRRSPVGPKGAWPAVEVRFSVKGAGVLVTVDDSGPDWLELQIDGRPVRAIGLQPGVQTFEARADRPGNHTYSFIKRTEPIVGTIQFLQYEAEDGAIEAGTLRKRCVEVIGDSITCGYGVEAQGPHEGFRAETENACESYGWMAAKKIGADAELIAWSGRKIWPDDTIPSIYDLTNPTDPSSVYDFKGPEPEAVVINLGTNDFSNGAPDEAEWTGAYKGFLARLRNHYPKAMLYPAIGPMLNDETPAGQHQLSTIRNDLTHMVDALRAAGDKRVRLLEFDTQRPDDGFGANYHPNLTTQTAMAERLDFVLKRDLKW